VDRQHKTRDKPVDPGVNFFDARFTPVDKSRPDIRINETTGELQYLWNHPVILYCGMLWTPLSLMQGLYPRVLYDVPTAEDALKVRLSGDGMLVRDCEQHVAIAGFQISRRRVDFYQPTPSDGPLFDHTLRERRALEIVIKDHTGATLDQKTFSSIPFGFDTEIVEGEFYEHPATGFYYRLMKIEEDGRRQWLLLESYQHGKFIQVEFIDVGQPVKGYVRVDDEPTRARLRCRLARLQQKRKP